MEQGYVAEKYEKLGNIGNVFKGKPRKRKAQQALRGGNQRPGPRWERGA